MTTEGRKEDVRDIYTERMGHVTVCTDIITSGYESGAPSRAQPLASAMRLL